MEPNPRIIAIQKRIETEPDGFWGPCSILACKRHLTNLMPTINLWPFAGQRDLTKFYGEAGDEIRLVNLPVDGLGVKFEGKPVKTIRCHQRVASSLQKILVELSKAYPEVLADYCGCYNNRSMRGSTTPSLHARGAAIDFCAGANSNHAAWPVVATMPLGVMEIFAREGWIAAGAFWGRDAMHFQATR